MLIRRGFGAISCHRATERAIHPTQERVDQLRQVVAVAAFQNRSGRNIRVAEPLTERREIFRLECHLGDRIARVRIEAGGNKKQIGLEGHESIERAAHLGDMLRARRKRRDGKIVNIAKGARPGAWIPGKLMNGGERDPRIVRDDLFGPVAMMRVEIPDRHPLCAVRERVERSDCDVAEITKAHGAIARRVMAGRAHQTEGALSPHGLARHIHRRTRRAGRMFVYARMRRGIGIEIFCRVTNSREMFTRVGTQYGRFIGGPWLSPFPVPMPILQERDGAGDSSGPLGMPRRRVLDATRVVKDDHGNYDGAEADAGSDGNWASNAFRFFFIRIS